MGTLRPGLLGRGTGDNSPLPTCAGVQDGWMDRRMHVQVGSCGGPRPGSDPVPVYKPVCLCLRARGRPRCGWGERWSEAQAWAGAALR